MPKSDPYRDFRFRIEIDALRVGGFQTVGGLARETTVEPYREGGLNDYEYQHVVKTTYPPLALKRGLFDSGLWHWHGEVIAGRIERRNIRLTLADDAGGDAWSWTCLSALPVKWTGPELDALGNGVAAESVEFVHHGLTGQRLVSG